VIDTNSAEIIDGLSMIIDQNLLDLEAKEREIQLLRNCAVLSDQENDRLRAENEEMRKWIHGQREVVRMINENRDTLRAEVSELRNCAVLSDQENERLRAALLDRDVTVMAYGENITRLIEERDTLRELVLEAQEYAVLPASLDRKWHERAEKALAP